MRISYFYNTPVPSQLAAPVQILNTCWHLADQGVPTTVYTGPLTGDVESCLHYYGLAPHPRLCVEPMPALPPRRRWLHSLLSARAADEPHLLISRGEQGIALFDTLRRLPHWETSAARRFIYEAHRLSFTQAGRWQPSRVPGWQRVRARWRSAQMRRCERRAVEHADGLLCLTAGVEQALREHFALRAPVLILPSGTAPPPDEPPPLAARDIDILYAGKFRRRKGIYDLIEALQSLPGRRLWMVGGTDADRREVQAFAEVLGVREQVYLPGFVEPAQVRDLYSRARVGVCPLPSGESEIAERFTSPLKVLEMMACSTPIVGTNVDSLREILVHEQTALLVEPSQPEDLARGIRQLLNDKTKAAALAKAARREVERYTWANRARRLREFLAELG